MKKNAKLKKRKKMHNVLRRDNRGSAIVLVIIAMAMIGVLASTILWSAYMNYMIKCADVRNKNSFYSAETVVEQIMAGMQHEASAAVSLSYQEVMKNWDNDENESTRFSRFTTSYLDALVKNLQVAGSGGHYYNRAVLESYVDAELFANVNLTVWNTPAGQPADNTMELINNSTLVIHNIRVSYTDENNYVSVVNTDICIDVPKLVFYQAGSIDNLYEYALIGNTGIETKTGSGASVVDGSIYGGADTVNNTGGININSASNMTVKNGRLVISKGDITVNGPSAGFIVRDVPDFESKVYAQGLSVNSGTLSLDSKTYVANDLILSGNGSKVTLTKEYYGYGSSVNTGIDYDPGDESTEIEADKSSAILINGRSATIDMSGITRLMLAGRAYIGQERTPGSVIAPEHRSKPVLMGESIAVKGDQIAYLVPAECIGVFYSGGEGKTAIGQNPMNAALVRKMDEYKGLYGSGMPADPNADYFMEVDFNKPVYKLGGKTLSEFGVNDMNHIRKVYAQYNSIEPDNQLLLYYYLVMDKEKAAEYFRQYYDFNSNKEALDNYYNKYASGGIILGDYAAENTQYTILGNSIVSDAVSGMPTLYTKPDVSGGAEEGQPAEGYQEIGDNAQEVTNKWEEIDVLDESARIADIYSALCTNLTDDASTIGAGQNVFRSIINEDFLRDYFNLPENAGLDVIEFTTSDGLKAVLTNKDTYIPTDNKIRLIVAIDKNYDPTDPSDVIDGGNVVINSNFTGLVIAQGKITIGSNVSVSRNKTDVYKVLNTNLSDTNEQKAMDFFVNGSGTLAGEVTEEAKVDASGTLDINLSKIVRYSNWIKR